MYKTIDMTDFPWPCFPFPFLSFPVCWLEEQVVGKPAALHPSMELPVTSSRLSLDMICAFVKDFPVGSGAKMHCVRSAASGVWTQGRYVATRHRVRQTAGEYRTELLPAMVKPW